MTTSLDEAHAMSILIIEANTDTAECLARFLMLGCGWDVATAPDGPTGIRLALENHPDVVVCDIELPKRNGLLVAEELAALPSRPLLIAITGYAEQITEGLAFVMGFDHFLAKPADPFAIQAIIEAHAEHLCHS